MRRIAAEISLLSKKKTTRDFGSEKLVHKQCKDRETNFSGPGTSIFDKSLFDVGGLTIKRKRSAEVLEWGVELNRWWKSSL